MHPRHKYPHLVDTSVGQVVLKSSSNERFSALPSRGQRTRWVGLSEHRRSAVHGELGTWGLGDCSFFKVRGWSHRDCTLHSTTSEEDLHCGVLTSIII